MHINKIIHDFFNSKIDINDLAKCNLDLNSYFNYANIDKFKSDLIEDNLQLDLDEYLTKTTTYNVNSFSKLNVVYTQNIINCNTLSFPTLNIELILKLWINGYIEANDDIDYLIMYFMLKDQLYNSIVKSTYKNYLISKIIKEVTSVKKYKNLFYIYREYINIKLIKYLSIYFVKIDNNFVVYLNNDQSFLDNKNIMTFLRTLLYNDYITLEIVKNCDYIFIDNNKYIYLYNDKLKYVGINRILNNDEKTIKNLNRAFQIKNII